ncbi:MAG: hypothetical protein HOW73_46545 [Polyangiaceae bacterium]|nr:hypothetical protein [Polyangiaceae bacterium]
MKSLLPAMFAAVLLAAPEAGAAEVGCDPNDEMQTCELTIAPDDALEPEDIPPPPRKMDHVLTIDDPAPHFSREPTRFNVRLGKDLPLTGGDGTVAGRSVPPGTTMQSQCGTLGLGIDGDGRPDRIIELHVRPAGPRAQLDFAADIGDRPGEVMVMLNPPTPEFKIGYLNVDFNCDGHADQHFPVWVLMPLLDEGLLRDDRDENGKPILIQSDVSTFCGIARASGSDAAFVWALAGLPMMMPWGPCEEVGPEGLNASQVDLGTFGGM